MSYPTSLVWGRQGPDQQIDRLIKTIADELPPMPPTLQANTLQIIREAVEEWEPFVATRYAARDT